MLQSEVCIPHSSLVHQLTSELIQHSIYLFMYLYIYLYVYIITLMLLYFGFYICHFYGNKILREMNMVQCLEGYSQNSLVRNTVYTRTMNIDECVAIPLHWKYPLCASKILCTKGEGVDTVMLLGEAPFSPSVKTSCLTKHDHSRERPGSISENKEKRRKQRLPVFSCL